MSGGGGFCLPPPPALAGRWLRGQGDAVGGIPGPAAVMQPVDVLSPASKRRLPGCLTEPGFFFCVCVCFILKYKAVQKPHAFSLFEVALANCLKNILQWWWKKKKIPLRFTNIFVLFRPFLSEARQ